MKEILVLKESLGSITKAGDLFNKIKKIKIDYNQENFLIFCLNSNNQVIDKKVLFKGGLNTCLIDPKTIFSWALKKNTNSIIIAHNHPSNDLEPSNEDKSTLNTLKEAGNILQLKVLDFIIFNKKEFYSMDKNLRW